jgi:MerR family transcriptional regulator, mercuric resistance operon regulatory protein
MALRISELANAGGVGVETVRFYQRKGLLKAPDGPALAGRHYGSDDVRRLRFVRSAQDAGFTLKEIAELLALDRSNDRPRAREMARVRIADLDAKIETLTHARNKLAKLARECAGSKSGPCPIIASFE